MLMPYPTLGGPEAMELDSQTVHAVCEGVQSPHGKVEHFFARGPMWWMPYLKIEQPQV